MKTPMKVDFHDTVENWRLWGELVELWIFDLHPKPTDTTKLINQMTAHGIKGADVYGPKPRAVKIEVYAEDGPLVIDVPSQAMVKEGRKSVHANQPYPLPVFYDLAYSGSRKVLSAEEDTLFLACRIGEYTINNCA
jgi:hypothetical protein